MEPTNKESVIHIPMELPTILGLVVPPDVTTLSYGLWASRILLFLICASCANYWGEGVYTR